MKIDTNILLTKAKRDIEKDLEDFNSLQFPPMQEVSNFRVTDEVYKEMPKTIRKNKLIPTDGNQVIYVMRFVEQFKTKFDLEIIKQEASDVKNKNHDGHRQVTGFTDQNWEHQTNCLNDITLYVGTSQSFASRIRQHVGWGHKGTATLLLRRWPSLVSGRFKITLDRKSVV